MWSQSVPEDPDWHEVEKKPEKWDWYQTGVAALRILLLQAELQASFKPVELLKQPKEARISLIQDELLQVWGADIVPAEAVALATTMARLIAQVCIVPRATQAIVIDASCRVHACVVRQWQFKKEEEEEHTIEKAAEEFGKP